MGDKGGVNPQSSKKMDKKRRKESDQRQGEGSLEQGEAQVEEQIIDAESLKGISDQAEDKPSTSMKLRRRHTWPGLVDEGHVEETGKSSDAFVQDQIIIAPEIMSMILGQLDLRSLKICRRVCKSWLQEAQSHLEHRTVVRFKERDYSARMTAFKETRQKKLLTTLPQPLSGLDVQLYFYRYEGEYSAHQCVAVQLQEILRSPVQLTKFSAGNMHLELALPLIIESSSSLEYLKLKCGYWTDWIPMAPNQSFPKLRHVVAVTSQDHHLEESINRFPSIVASIVNASPTLDTFESKCLGRRGTKLGRELLLRVNIKNVKTLILSRHELKSTVPELCPLSSFSQLRCFKIEDSEPEDYVRLYHEIFSEVWKSTDTLKELDLSMYGGPEFQKLLLKTEFPVCPNVEELTLVIFDDDWSRIISTNFPALRVLNFESVLLTKHSEDWNWPSWIGVKTLRATCHYCKGDSKEVMEELAVKFLGKFPQLERMYLDPRTLVGCCRLKATGEPEFSNGLKCLKHLELHGDSLGRLDTSSFGALQGIETITMLKSSADISFIPFEDLPCLKLIQFPWGACLNLDKLLEMSGRVKKVIVTNCCSVLRVKGQESKELMDKFFDSARNAECGCSMNLTKYPDCKALSHLY